MFLEKNYGVVVVGGREYNGESFSIGERTTFRDIDNAKEWEILPCGTSILLTDD
jgi:hypothetical protein